MLIKDQAICIRTVDFSETSQVVTFFTKATGKVTAIAKGSKRPKSAFDGPIEMFAVGDVVFSDRRTDKLATLTEFQPRPAFRHLAGNLFALNCSIFAAELLERLTNDYDPHPELFKHFLEFLQNLDSEHRTQLIWLILFQLALLNEIGLRPILNACTNCRAPFSQAWHDGYFSSSANGLICRDCEAAFADKIGLSPQGLECLANVRLLGDTDEKTLQEIEKVLIHHLTVTLGRRPKMAAHILGK
jgi:DNA repair protein RecO (recombination protein O)